MLLRAICNLMKKSECYQSSSKYEITLMNVYKLTNTNDFTANVMSITRHERIWAESISFTRIRASVRVTGMIHSATKAPWNVKKDIFDGGMGKPDLLLSFVQVCHLTLSSQTKISFIFMFIYNLSFNTINGVEKTVYIPYFYQYKLKF